MLALVFLLQIFFASRLKSPTFDEPAHIAAGLSYWQTRNIAANPQHPPLLKELSGLALLAAGVRLPDTPLVRNMETGAPGAEYTVGAELIRDQGTRRVLFWARLPFLIMSTLAGVLLFAWGRQLLGEGAACAALFLYALSPTVIAHSFLVTTDAGLAAFALLFFFALWNYLRYPSWTRMLLCGAAMGAMLATKFSAVALVPVGAALLFASLRWSPARSPGSPRAFWEHDAIHAPPEGKNAPCPCGSGKKYKMCHGAMPAESAAPAHRILARCVLIFIALCAIALIFVEACYFFPADWLTYLAGAKQVNADHDPDYLALLGGRLDHHFLLYYAAVWLLKEPLAGLMLAAIGIVELIRTRAVSPLAKLFLIVPPAVLFIGYSIAADDFGVRYLIPVLFFVYLIAGWGLRSLWERRAWWSRGAAACLCGWLAVEAAGIYPDHLSYFNELACLPSHVSEIGVDGGSRCGTLWLDDHNVDWGQGLAQLKRWLDIHEPGRPVKLAYFGSFPPDAYGFTDPPVEMQTLMAKMPDAGLYAISAHLVARLPQLGVQFGQGEGDWLRTTKPVAIIGHAFYIYDIPRFATSP